MNEYMDHSGWPTWPLYEYSWTRPVRIHRIARSYNNRCRDPRGELRGGGSSTACPIYASSNGVLFHTVPYHFVLFLLTVLSFLALVFKGISWLFWSDYRCLSFNHPIFWSVQTMDEPRISSGVSIPNALMAGNIYPAKTRKAG